MNYYSPYVVKRVRNAFIALLVLHLLLLGARIVFDILGHVYLLILLNAITLCFVALTVFATCSFKAKPLLVFVIWLVPWIIFNAFVMLVYFNFIHLSDHDYWYNFQYRKNTWFFEKAFGCTFKNAATKPQHDQRIDTCLVSYEHLEIIQAGVQIIVSILEIFTAWWLNKKFKIEEEEEYFGFFGGFDSFSARVSPTESSRPKIKYVHDDM